MASSRSNSSSSSSLAALTTLVVAALLLAVPRPGAAQPSSAPAPSSSSGSCMTEIVSLYPCLGYMSGNASKPSASCCSALSSVVTSNPRCLCVVLGGGASSLGVTINDTRALELPGACTVKTPPPSQCKSVGVPVPHVPSSSSTPPATPASTTPASPAPSTTPASPASASVPVAPAGAAGAGTKATQTAASSGGGGKATPVLHIVAAAVLSAAVALLHA